MPRTKKSKDVSKQTEGQAEPTTLRPWKQTPNGKENGSGKYVKAPQTLLKLDKSGGIKKSKKPVSALTIDANKAARLALATGVITKDELNRRTDRDLRTLYLRFKSSDTAPKSSQDIFALEKGIKDVRIPRQAKATGKHNIKYCFVEFSDESTCDSTKDKLAANPDFVVDYVGEKSKNRQANASAGVTNKFLNKMPINPVRLHVSGFGTKMTQDKLKALFPKSRSALIPEKVDHYGFVNFDNPADAKAAFDAANKLKVDTEDGTQSMTVVFARMKKHGNVEKAEDKTPKKRKKADESAEVKKADEAQAAWDGVKKAKKTETEETATEEVVEESTDKDVENVEDEQSESDEDVENDEAEEEDDNDEVENDKAEQKETTIAENSESEEKKEAEEEVKEPVVEKDKVDDKVEENDEDEEDANDDVENDEIDNDDESD